MKQHPYLSAPRHRHPVVDPASNNKNTSRKKKSNPEALTKPEESLQNLCIKFSSHPLSVWRAAGESWMHLFTMFGYHKSKCIVFPEVDNFFPMISMLKTQFCSPARGDDRSHKLMWHMQAFDFLWCYCVWCPLDSDKQLSYWMKPWRKDPVYVASRPCYWHITKINGARGSLGSGV